MGNESSANATDERKAKRDALKAQREEQRKEREKARKISAAQAAAAEKAQEEALRRQQKEAEKEQAALAKQLQAQLSDFKKYANENSFTAPILDGEVNDGGDAADKPGATRPSHRSHKRVGADDKIEDAENISIHSSDLQDEDLLQGLQDLDDELEQEFQGNVESLQAQIDEHKAASLRFLREENDKPNALLELQKAKALEAELAVLRNEHEKPLGARIDEAKQQVDELEDQVKEKKRDALAKLRAGEKPIALEMMREVKGLEAQLETVKSEHEKLVQQRDQQLRAGVSSK